jgi:secreted trypsin-like serine protease
MRKRLSILGSVAVLAVVAVTPAAAITGGTVDGNAHPEVGAMLADFGNGQLNVLCTGTLISPRVFLSAAHCTDYLASLGITDVYVTFDPSWNPTSPGTAYHGTYYTDPDYGYSGKGGSSDPHDIAVVVLDSAINSITPAELPSPGVLDNLDLKSAGFTAVGYGTVREVKTKGPNALFFDGVRRYAEQSFLSLQKAWLNLDMNFSTGSGGTCYGDSGGPHFYGGPSSNQLVSTTITGDSVCRATDKTYRLDTASALNFLHSFEQYGPYTYWPEP